MVKDIILTFLTGGLWLIVVLIRNATRKREYYETQTKVANEISSQANSLMSTYKSVLQTVVDQVEQEIE